MKKIMKTITSQILTSVITIGIIAGGGYAFAAKQAGDTITAADWNQLVNYAKGDWTGSKTFDNPTMKGLSMLPLDGTEEVFCRSHGYDYSDDVIVGSDTSCGPYSYITSGIYGNIYNSYKRTIHLSKHYSYADGAEIESKAYIGRASRSIGDAVAWSEVKYEKYRVTRGGRSTRDGNTEAEVCASTPISVIKTITCKKY